MTPAELAAVRGRLEEFAAEVFAPPARVDQRDKGMTYLRGLLLDGRRKSMQPMAERLGRSPGAAAVPLLVHLAGGRGPQAAGPPGRSRVISPDAWVIDDTSSPRTGTAPPGADASLLQRWPSAGSPQR
jgi:hypothetical protein